MVSKMKLVILFLCGLSCVAAVRSRTKICDRIPTINGLCVTSTLGIYYDAETERCKYLGCSTDKRIFSTLQDCERICNSTRRRRERRVNGKSSNSSKD